MKYIIFNFLSNIQETNCHSFRLPFSINLDTIMVDKEKQNERKSI